MECGSKSHNKSELWNLHRFSQNHSSLTMLFIFSAAAVGVQFQKSAARKIILASTMSIYAGEQKILPEDVCMSKTHIYSQITHITQM